MSVLAAALISFLGFGLLALHLKRRTLMRIAGYAMWFDIVVHGSVIYLFMGTSTLGLLQAELSAIFMTIALRTYRVLIGYQRYEAWTWVSYTGLLTR